MTGHTTSPLVYLVVFGGLIALTVLTVVAALLPVGAWHTPVALAIAIAKATLVVLFFMHALQSERLTWAVIVTALFMLVLLIVGVLGDFLAQPWISY